MRPTEPDVRVADVIRRHGAQRPEAVALRHAPGAQGFSDGQSTRRFKLASAALLHAAPAPDACGI